MPRQVRLVSSSVTTKRLTFTPSSGGNSTIRRTSFCAATPATAASTSTTARLSQPISHSLRPSFADGRHLISRARIAETPTPTAYPRPKTTPEPSPCRVAGRGNSDGVSESSSGTAPNSRPIGFRLHRRWPVWRSRLIHRSSSKARPDFGGSSLYRSPATYSQRRWEPRRSPLGRWPGSSGLADRAIFGNRSRYVVDSQ